jgi:hypothetical protein
MRVRFRGGRDFGSMGAGAAWTIISPRLNSAVWAQAQHFKKRGNAVVKPWWPHFGQQIRRMLVTYPN